MLLSGRISRVYERDVYSFILQALNGAQGMKAICSGKKTAGKLQVVQRSGQADPA